MPWQQLAVSWFIRCGGITPQATSTEMVTRTTLASLYQMNDQTKIFDLASTSQSPRPQSVIITSSANPKPTAKDDLQNALRRDQRFDATVSVCGASLLVMINACLSQNDWEALTPLLWNGYGSSEGNMKAVSPDERPI